MSDLPAHASRVLRWFESLSSTSLERIGEIYAHDAEFSDPFQEVRGTEAIRRVFAHMFANLHQPRFVVTRAHVDGLVAYVSWRFIWSFASTPERVQEFKGVTVLTFDAQGLIIRHEDYWDAARGVYEKLPWLGGLVRYLRRRMSA